MIVRKCLDRDDLIASAAFSVMTAIWPRNQNTAARDVKVLGIAILGTYNAFIDGEPNKPLEFGTHPLQLAVGKTSIVPRPKLGRQ